MNTNGGNSDGDTENGRRGGRRSNVPPVPPPQPPPHSSPIYNPSRRPFNPNPPIFQVPVSPIIPNLPSPLPSPYDHTRAKVPLPPIPEGKKNDEESYLTPTRTSDSNEESVYDDVIPDTDNEVLSVVNESYRSSMDAITSDKEASTVISKDSTRDDKDDDDDDENKITVGAYSRYMSTKIGDNKKTSEITPVEGHETPTTSKEGNGNGDDDDGPPSRRTRSKRKLVL